MRPFLLLGALLLTSFGVAACSSTEEDLCDARCECERCSPGQYDDCLRTYDRDARDAEFYGCPAFYDDWVACRQATYFCDARFRFQDRCGPERGRLNNCIRR